MSDSNFHVASFKSSKMKDQESFDHLWANLPKTYKYTPVTHGEPPSHGTTVYGIIPPTYNIYDGSRRCVKASQPIQFWLRCPQRTTLYTFTESV